MRRVEVDNVGEVRAALGSALGQVALFSADLIAGLALVLETITVTKEEKISLIIFIFHII